MTILVTGVAGFIGSNLAQRLLAQGRRVAGLDNLSLGRERNLRPILGRAGFSLHVVDLADRAAYRRVVEALHVRDRITEIWHLAASSDIPSGVANAEVDLRDTFMTTFNTLVLMRELGIKTMAFSSSSAIYGDRGDQAIVEDAGPLFPISNYGAMKLASEAAISAALETHLERAFVFRFPNVVGVPATHGVILDFVRKLRATPSELRVLGDGSQRKCYLHVDDLLSAMRFVRQNASDRLSYYNIGPRDDGITVRAIAEAVVAELSPGARITYGNESRGWVGDVPKFRYSVAKLSKLGWHAKLDSAGAVRKAVREVLQQESEA